MKFSSVAHWCLTFCDPMDCSTPDFPVHHQLPEFTQTHVHGCHPTISSCPLLLLPSIFPSIKVFSYESLLGIRWLKYWSFSFSINPFKENQDWFDILAVLGTLKSLLQHHSSKASILLAIKFLYSPTLTSIRDYWENHSFD